MAKTKPKWSEEDWVRAFRVYCELNSINATAERLQMPFSTVRARSVKEHWKAKREELIEAHTNSPVLYDQHLTQVIKDLGLNANDSETFRNIKNLEMICMQTIKDGKPQMEGKDVKLYPVDFKEAVNALKKIWDAKEGILSRLAGLKDQKPGVKIEQTFNFLELVKQAGKQPQTIDIPKQIDKN